ncbi:hypothetical protein CL617_01270 [archaeon]|nr:hypothetical protein [archaeon]|tara:strand:- start:1118 stop:1753 length:636 start_codon:yes stop_codon:yes gene_type:complete
MFLFKKRGKRGQFWYIDLMIALFVIVVISVLFVKSIGDIVNKEKVINDLLGEGIDISNSIMSGGYLPAIGNWCATDEGRIGFVDDAKIDTKLDGTGNFDEFKNIFDRNDCVLPNDDIVNGYDKSKILLGSNVEYVVYLQDKTGSIIGGKYYGFPLGPIDPLNIGTLLGKIDSSEAPEDKVNIFRYAFLDTDNVDGEGELVRIGITVWKPTT